ncbi:MAG: hypothetical protein ACREON_06420 [Gemmatimonadaceae bacterium]
MRPIVIICAALGVWLAAPETVAGQAQSAFRFQMDVTSDSTFSFATERHDWVKRGLRGVAVDPVRRDALVARFEVVRVNRGRATALVTGQTTRVTSDHVALLDRPSIRWYQRASFWLGAAAGAVVGAVVAH